MRARGMQAKMGRRSVWVGKISTAIARSASLMFTLTALLMLVWAREKSAYSTLEHISARVDVTQGREAGAPVIFSELP